MFGKKKNAVRTTGIIELLDPGDEGREAYIAVSYMVEEKEYTIRETVRMKSKPIKVGKTTVGHRTRPALGWIKVGSEARVEYDPADPASARLPDNKGGAPCE